MTDTEAQALREDYLRRLDDAIQDLPWRVATDLRGGIAEELDGLGADEVRARIQRLGDPAEIAAAAREEAASATVPPSLVPSPASAAPVARPFVERRAYGVVIALVLGFGGLVVPVAGWLIGIALVTSSRLWRRWEKAVALLLPVVGTVAMALVLLILGLVGGGGDRSGPGGSNPVLPTSFDLWHLGVIGPILLIPIGALWLIWRLSARGPRA